MKSINAAKEIEKLLNFALQKGMIEGLDVVVCRNALLELLQVSEPYSNEIEQEKIESPVDILENLLDYAAEIGILTENTTTYRDLLDAKIMGILMPRQSEVIKKFNSILEKSGPEAATDDFYSISKASNYIRMDRIEKNLYWLTATEYGNLEITVNLSKPEKDPKEIAASKLRPQSNYPKCLLCIENIGFAGHINHPARQNHRVIPFELAKEQWYFQYSPYVYYNEHCILFKGEHVPMKLSKKTLERMFDFVGQLPHYFIGSNADLPIVGGSILSHDHFQGGRHVFPMEEAGVEKRFSHSEYKDVKCSIVKWPMSVIRMSSKSKEQLIALSMTVFDGWKGYSDEALDILSATINGDETIPHNTVTPIARINKDGEFEIDLVLRNNRTSEEHPDGIFHPHKELHHIKKENIGLIEVMGLAVLPARLNTELKEIEAVLTGQAELRKFHDVNSPIFKHLNWIECLVEKYGVNNDPNKAEEILRQEVGMKFLQVLMDAGVYKRNIEGSNGFNRFMENIGFSLK